MDDQRDIGALANHTVHGSALIFAAQGLKFLVKIATQILIARLLLPEDYGLIAMVTPVLSLSQLMGDLGLGQAAVIDRNITSSEVSDLLWFGLGLNTVLTASVMALSPLIAWLYHEPRVLEITLIMAALLPVTGLSIQHIALINRQMKFKALALIDVVPPTVALATGLTGARLGWSYWSLLAAIAAETLTTSGLAWSLSRWRPQRPRLNPRIGRLLRIGSHITGLNLSQYFVSSLDNVLLGTVQGSTALGLYNRGYRLITQPIEHLFVPLSRVAIPLLTRLHYDPDHYRRSWRDIVSAATLIGIPGILFTMTMAHPLAVLILGPQWAGVAPIFFWLCFGALASPVHAAAFWLFITQEQTKRQMMYMIATSTITIGAFIAGLPWGPVGVAGGYGLAHLLITAPLVCWGATRRGVVNLTYLVQTLLPLAVTTALTGVALHELRRVLGDGVGGIAGMAVLAYAVFGVTLFCVPAGRPILRRVAHFIKLLITRGA